MPSTSINTSSTDTWLAALACRLIVGTPPIARTRHVSAPLSANVATRWLYASATSHIATTGEALRERLLTTLSVAPERIVSVQTSVDAARYRFNFMTSFHWFAGNEQIASRCKQIEAIHLIGHLAGFVEYRPVIAFELSLVCEASQLQQWPEQKVPHHCTLLLRSIS